MPCVHNTTASAKNAGHKCTAMVTNAAAAVDRNSNGNNDTGICHICRRRRHRNNRMVRRRACRLIGE
eukprot:1045179-Lingulodinium_polyedra.AAC.1